MNLQSINTSASLRYDPNSLPIEINGAKVSYALYFSDNSYIAGDIILSSEDGLDFSAMTIDDINKAALVKLESLTNNYIDVSEDKSPKNITVDTTKTSVTIGGE